MGVRGCVRPCATGAKEHASDLRPHGAPTNSEPNYFATTLLCETLCSQRASNGHDSCISRLHWRVSHSPSSADGARNPCLQNLSLTSCAHSCSHTSPHLDTANHSLSVWSRRTAAAMQTRQRASPGPMVGMGSPPDVLKRAAEQAAKAQTEVLARRLPPNTVAARPMSHAHCVGTHPHRAAAPLTVAHTHARRVIRPPLSRVEFASALPTATSHELSACESPLALSLLPTTSSLFSWS
jgi:hypothetical protein